jgi:hypothetical protein
MANKDKFMEMLENVINNDQAKAEELFHALVVEKSREIYENLFNEEYKDVDLEEADEDDEDEDEVDESTETDDEDEEVEEMFGQEAVGGDAGDDFMQDVGAGEEDDMGGDEMDDGDMDMGGDEGSVEDRVMDLEDALADLKAEFEKLMGDEANEPEHHDGVDDPDFGGMDDMDGEEEDEGMMPFEEEIEELSLSPAEQMREYVEKVGEAYKGGKVASSSETGGPNTKSIVAKKNDMGGTTANIAKGGTGSEKGTTGGLLNPSSKEDNAGNVNVPGAKSATKLSAVSKGHGAEKKGAGESGADKKSLFR